MPEFGVQRETMVRRQIAARGVRDPHVLKAMLRVPREVFVDDAMREFAYEDSPLPIGSGQTISQPFIVARMVEIAHVEPGDRVLEIGTGSGYAAAVLAQIAQRVCTIERHATLADIARQRYRALGYDNIEVRTGDGTEGWPDAAPFDAIIASAGAPGIPEVLRTQLAIGGRLVLPVGASLHHQQLVRVTRTDEFRFEQEEMDHVAFVPLIGTYGWAEDGSRPMPAPERSRERDDAPVVSLPAKIARAAQPLPAFDDPAFGRAFDRFADARVLLLGEASHGTSEFYRARDAITRHCVEHHGVRIVAAEADWPDMAVVDRFVRHRPPRDDAEPPFTRFPTWMWRNREFEALAVWMRAFNQARDPEDRAGVFGLDLYSMGRSIRAVVDYLEGIDPELAKTARARYGCLMPWTGEPQEYGRLAWSSGHAFCEEAAVEMLVDLLAREADLLSADSDTSWFDATQNARLVRNAEKYYRTMYKGAAESWNQRDRHMFETLQHLLDAGGPDAKAIVWAHNSHLGDARHTEMAMRGELNLGQLCKEAFGERAVSIGFGTHAGTVAAASDWDARMEVMQLRKSLPDSYERACHDATRERNGVPRFLLDLRAGGDEALREALTTPRLERFVGVVYRPETERFSHYAQAVLPGQFDGWVWFDETRAVDALPTTPSPGMPETYPFGL